MSTATGAITFLDSADDVISEYKPFGRTWNTKKYEFRLFSQTPKRIGENVKKSLSK